MHLFRLSLLLLLALGWAGWAHAFSFVATSAVDASSDASGATSVTCSKPTGTVDNDIMFAVTRTPNEAVTAPSGWNSFGSPLTDTDAASTERFSLYWRVASSEGTTYTWSSATASRKGCSIYTFRDDFNTSDPIDVTSNTSYETADTNARVASMTTTATNEALILFGVQIVSTSQSCTAHPTSPITFTEHADAWNTSSRFQRCVSSGVWSSSGSTGTMDTTLSNSNTSKHGFGVALKPATGGAARPSGLLLGVW